METRTRRLGRGSSSTTTVARSPGCASRGTRVDVASRPAGIEASVPAPVAERLDTRSGRRVLGPVTLGRSQSSPLLGTSDGRRVLTATDGQLVVARRDDARSRPRASRPGRCTGSVIALGPNDRTVAVGGHDGSRSLRGPAERSAADGIGPAPRAGDGRALHAGRPLAGHDERGRRGDPVGRRRPRGVRDAAGARQRDHGAADLRRRPNPLHRRARRRDLHVGPRRHAAPRPADRHRCAQRGARGAERGRPAAGARPCERHDHRGRSELGPSVRRTFAVVPRRGAVTGIRFVPGSRLAVVLGPGELIALVDTDTRPHRAHDRRSARR